MSFYFLRTIKKQIFVVNGKLWREISVWVYHLQTVNICFNKSQTSNTHFGFYESKENCWCCSVSPSRWWLNPVPSQYQVLWSPVLTNSWYLNQQWCFLLFKATNVIHILRRCKHDDFRAPFIDYIEMFFTFLCTTGSFPKYQVFLVFCYLLNQMLKCQKKSSSSCIHKSDSTCDWSTFICNR